MFASSPGGPGSILESYQRLKKWYLMTPCLIPSTQKYGLRVNGENPGLGVAPSLYLTVVAIEKGAFEPHSTTVG